MNSRLAAAVAVALLGSSQAIPQQTVRLVPQSSPEEDGSESNFTRCPHPMAPRGGELDLSSLATKLGLPPSVHQQAKQTRMDLGGRGSPDGIIDVMSGPDDVTTPNLVRPEVAKDHYRLLNLPQLEGEVLDIGSHVGAVAILLARTQPNLARIHAFEPSPLNYFFLVWNVHLNNVTDRVIPRHIGLSSTGKSATFVVSTVDSTGNRMRTVGDARNGEVWGGGGQQTTVKTMRLDNFLQLCRVSSVSYVKLDCEGCEYEIVPANEAFFASAVSHLSGELHTVSSTIASKAALSSTRRIICKDRRQQHGAAADGFHNCDMPIHWYLSP